MNEKIALALDQYTTEQKLDLMEELWSDLTKNPQEFQSPDWHENVLNEREQALQNGKTAISDWEDAKKRIREKVHAGKNS